VQVESEERLRVRKSVVRWELNTWGRT